MPLKKILLACFILLSFKSTSQVLTYAKIIELKPKLNNTYYRDSSVVLNVLDELREAGIILTDVNNIISSYPEGKNYKNYFILKGINSTSGEEVEIFTNEVYAKKIPSEQYYILTFKTNNLEQYLNWIKDIRTDNAHNLMIVRDNYTERYANSSNGETVYKPSLYVRRPYKRAPRKVDGATVTQNIKAIAPYQYILEMTWRVRVQ